MSSLSALTTYKKQEGVLALTQDRKSISWTPTNSQDGKPAMTIGLQSITNFQQTLPTNPKVQLRIIVLLAGQTEPVAHTFAFISPSNARAEADSIKAALTAGIQAVKAAESKANGTSGGSSAAMAIASAISSGSGKKGNLWEDDERLLKDASLQQSLLKANPALLQTYQESANTRPDGITRLQFNSQFWSTRIHLLRAHAIESSQSRGSYNVLSVLKPSATMNISQEQIKLIFNQHPLVRKAYDREVPKPLNEPEFWSRFFQSRLLKKLRGERIDPSDKLDKIFDKYLDEDEFTGRSRAHDATIPRMIDVEGNEENNSQRKGNAPDISLRPRGMDKVPIIRTLNSLSEKIMAHVAPSDIDPSQPIGMDETTYNNLRLRDLQGDPEQSRAILKVRDQSHFFSENKDANSIEDVFAKPRRDPSKTIKGVHDDITNHFQNPGADVLQVRGEPGDGEETDATAKQARDPAHAATAHIFELLRQNRLQTEPIPSSSGLSSTMYERVQLTHATTTEFLHQFWSAFLSGKPERVDEIKSLVESLDRAMDRIQAVAAAADEERRSDIKNAEAMANERFQRTGRKSKLDESGVSGGSKIVMQLLEPTTNALAIAAARYKQALAEQMREDG